MWEIMVTTVSRCHARVQQHSTPSFSSYILSTPSCNGPRALEGVVQVSCLGLRLQHSLILSTLSSYKSLQQQQLPH